MMILKRTLLGLALAAGLYFQAVSCPVDGSGAYFVGKIKTDISGRQLWLYRCNQFQHEFWVAQ